MTPGSYIVALGARTPLGLLAESSAAAVRAGVCRLREHPFLVDGAGAPLVAARDPLLCPRLSGPARLVAMAATALGQVLTKLGAHRSLSAPIPVLLALPERRPGFGVDEIRRVVEGLRAAALPGGAHVEIEVLAGGHAGVLRALATAQAQLECGAPLCIVGGVDSYLDADALDHLEEGGRIKREGQRGGFTPGEAAGMMALTTLRGADALRLPALARLRGVATGHEPRVRDEMTGVLGEGLGQVVAGVTAALPARGERIDAIYCDINGERHRSDDWGFVALRLASVFRDATDYHCPAASWGDVGAASGALSCVLAVQSFRRQHEAGPLTLVCASSDGGLRGAALLQRMES